MRQIKILKLLIFGMVFMLFGCVNDELISKMEHVHNSKTRIVSIDKVPIIVTSIQKFNKNYRLASKEDLTNNTSSIENLNLDLNNILVYTKINNGYTSYSIPIVNSIPNGQAYYFENLHVIGNNENSFIYRWTPQDKSIPFELKTFTGKLERFDTDYNLNYYDNYINGIKQPRTTQFGKIFKSGENYTDDYQISCTTVVFCGCASKDNYCGCDGSYSQCKYAIYNVCNSEGGGGGGGEGGGEGGSGGGGGGSTGDTGTGDGGTGDTGTGPTDPIDQPIDEVVPVIVEEDETPCGKMKKNSDRVNFRQNFANLDKQINYDLDYETGYYEKLGTNNKPVFNFMTGTIDHPTLNFIPGMISFMHIHMNDYYKTDVNGDVFLMKPVKNFSPADVFSLFGCAGYATQNNLSPYDSYAIMLSNEGIFAMNLIDVNISITPLIRKKMNDDYDKQSKIILKSTTLGSQNRKDKLQKMLLLLMKDCGLENKVALFEAIVTPPSQAGGLPTISWVKKTLDVNNNLLITPC
jgi:hypothetical protein